MLVSPWWLSSWTGMPVAVQLPCAGLLAAALGVAVISVNMPSCSRPPCVWSATRTLAVQHVEAWKWQYCGGAAVNGPPGHANAGRGASAVHTYVPKATPYTFGLLPRHLVALTPVLTRARLRMHGSPETLRLLQPACCHNQVPSHLLRHSESAGPVLGTEHSANRADMDQAQRVQGGEDTLQDIGG
jgi:hypothetical protein